MNNLNNSALTVSHKSIYEIRYANIRLYSSKKDYSWEDTLGLKDPQIKDPDAVLGESMRTGQETIEEIGFPDDISTMPKDIKKRKVARIYQRSKNVMQQGTDNTKDWILDFGTEERWENPTMGWTSSGDSMSNLQLEFPNMCAAVCFAERQGLRWTCVESKLKVAVKKNYSEIFSWNKRTRVTTK